MSVRLKVVCPSEFGGIVRQGHAAAATIHHALYYTTAEVTVVVVRIYTRFAIEDSCSVLIFFSRPNENYYPILYSDASAVHHHRK